MLPNQQIAGGFMSKYKNIKNFNDAGFRRLIGVKKRTFSKMLEVLREADCKRKRKGGPKNKLPLEDRLLMALEYLREYRTYFHLGHSYGVSESACYRTCVWVENTLIKSKVFSIPGKKALLNKNNDFEVVLIDASESPIERPKKKTKNKKN
jgi:hypothetical protein